MSERRKISVIIPHKNNADLLEQTLQSVFLQQRLPYEIIVVDDASSSEHKERIKKFSTKHHWNFKLLELKQTQGPSGARNRGIEMAKGDYIALLDADDLWSQNHLAFFVRALEKKPEIQFYSSKTLRGIKQQKSISAQSFSLQKVQYFELALQHPFVVNSSSVIIARSVFFDACKFNEQLKASEDMDMWICLGKKFPLYFQEAPTVFYNTSAKKSLSKNLSEYENPMVMEMMKKWWEKAQSEKEKMFIQLNYFGYWTRFVKAFKKPPSEIHQIIKPEYLSNRNRWIYRLLKNFF